MTTDAGLSELLARLGYVDFFQRLEEFDFDGLGEDVCDLLLAHVSGERYLEISKHDGRERADPREAVEGFIALLTKVAQQWPDRFVSVVAARPGLHYVFEVITALGSVDTAESIELLVDAVTVRRAGHGLARSEALLSLVRLGYPGVPDLLVALVKDRTTETRDAAVEVAIGVGDARLIPHLHRIAVAERTSSMTRDSAWDAIEAIALRGNLSDAPQAPHGRRLVSVPRPESSDQIKVLRLNARVELSLHGEAVQPGDGLAVLAVGSQECVVTSPCHGQIVSCLISIGRTPPPIMFWIRQTPEAEGWQTPIPAGYEWGPL